MNAKSSKQVVRANECIVRVLLWGVLVLVIVGVVSASIWSSIHPKSDANSQSTESTSRLAVHNELPDFYLTDQHRVPVGLATLLGKVWVADFIFTRCVTICPPMTTEMAALQEEFATEGLHFVSFSVDPKRDTPEVLSRYAARYGADRNRWSFLTGEKESIYQLAHAGFNLAAGHQGSDILHSTRFVLVDRYGQVRGYYDSRSKEALQQLRWDIKTLLQ